jgi:drug/metabolite transporter (DMT)-like permease
MNKLYLAIPAIADLIAGTFQFISMSLIPVSLYVMLKGGSLIIIYGFTRLFTDTKIYKHQNLGIIILICGILASGLSDTLFSKHNSSNENDENERLKITIGICFSLLGSVFLAIGQIY